VSPRSVSRGILRQLTRLGRTWMGCRPKPTFWSPRALFCLPEALAEGSPLSLSSRASARGFLSPCLPEAQARGVSSLPVSPRRKPEGSPLSLSPRGASPRGLPSPCLPEALAEGSPFSLSPRGVSRGVSLLPVSPSVSERSP